MDYGLYNLRKRPFWIDTGSVYAFKVGDRILRFTNTNSTVDATAINTSKASKRLGTTSAASVSNRTVWADTIAENGDVAILFGSGPVAPVGFDMTGGFAGGYKLYRQGGAWSETQILAGEAQVLELWSLGQMRRKGLGKLYPGSIASKITALTTFGAPEYYPNRRHFVMDHTIAIQKKPALTVNLFIRDVSVAWTCGAVAAAVDGRISPYQGTENGIPYVILGTAADMIGAKDATGHDGMAYVDSSISYNTEGVKADFHPAETFIRALMPGSTAYFTGNVRQMSGDNPGIIRVGFAHGIHECIRAVVVGADGEGKFVHAQFTPGQIAAIVRAQKQFVSDAEKVAMESMAVSVETTADVMWNLLFAATAVPAQDILNMLSIKKAVQDGADVSDILAYTTNGKTIAQWRTECLTDAPAQCLMYPVKRIGAVPGLPLTVSATTPFYTVGTVDAGKQYQVSSYLIDAVVAMSGGMYTNRAGLISHIESAKGIAVLISEDMDTVSLVASTEDSRPWEDLPGVWFKRHNAKNWQPVANCVLSAILEPENVFKL